MRGNMSKMMLCLIAIVGLMASACEDSFMAGDDQGDDLTTPDGSEFEAVTMGAGGSTDGGNAIEVILGFAPYFRTLGVEWIRIDLRVASVFLPEAPLCSNQNAEALTANTGVVLLSMLDNSSMRLRLEAPVERDFCKIEFMLSQSQSSIYAEGVLENGEKVVIDSSLYNLPFVPTGDYFRWSDDGKYVWVAGLDLSKMLPPDLLADLSPDENGVYRIDASSNAELLAKINNSIVNALSIYNDLNENGAVDEGEESDGNRVAKGSADDIDGDGDTPDPNLDGDTDGTNTGVCNPGETKPYECPDSELVPWCTCTLGSDGLGSWACIISPEVQCAISECKPGDKKPYECPDGDQVPWCDCVGVSSTNAAGMGKWNCIKSPETQCLSQECRIGDKKSYKCEDGSLVPWCECLSKSSTSDLTGKGSWVCIISPENQCTQGNCEVGEELPYECPDGKEVPWCECIKLDANIDVTDTSKDGRWSCIKSPETNCSPAQCRVGDKKLYECSDGQMVPWCECLADDSNGYGRWSCIKSPENQCDAGECKLGDKREYECKDGSLVPWCECVKDSASGKTRWSCIKSPEVQCKSGECTPGDKKDFECDDGSFVPWCDCLKDDDGLGYWSCIRSPENKCPDSPCELAGGYCEDGVSSDVNGVCGNDGYPIDVPCFDETKTCCMPWTATCKPEDAIEYECSDDESVDWCVCEEKKCKPDCLYIGSNSEGWYNPCTGKLLSYAQCAECTVECRHVGSYSEGWYDSCAVDPSISGPIIWARCRAEWECVEDPESLCSSGSCQAGEKKEYECPDGEMVPWCQCSVDDQGLGTWVCIVSPENQCSQGECTLGESKSYECDDGSMVPWCECTKGLDGLGNWTCIRSPENQCPPSPCEQAGGSCVISDPAGGSKCDNGESVADIPCSDSSAVCCMPYEETCKLGESIDYQCTENDLVSWCECVEGECKPECWFTGSNSEGWYNPCTGELFEYAECGKCYPSCLYIGTESEGWYDSCKIDPGVKGPIVWAYCHPDWSCVDNPEDQCVTGPCQTGEKREFECSDGSKVPWCVCSADNAGDGSWSCIKSPEAQCPQAECIIGEIKQFECPGGEMVDWCKCVPDKNGLGYMSCIRSPENQCSASACEQAGGYCKGELDVSVTVICDPGDAVVNVPCFEDTSSCCMSMIEVCDIGEKIFYECKEFGGIAWCECLEADCKPVCKYVGTKSEGWYNCKDELIVYGACEKCEAGCEYIGTDSEGWYSSCPAGASSSSLITWASCKPEWECEPDPESLCSMNSCNAGDERYYECPDGEFVKWCGCNADGGVSGTWGCIFSPENQCSD